MKINHPPLLLLPLILPLLSGCASNFGNASKRWEYHPAESVLTSVKVYDNGKLVKEETYAVFSPTNAPTKWRSSNRALALADSKNDVNKARSSTTDKTVSAGFDSTKQETSGEVVPGTIKAIGEAAPGIIKSAAGIP